MVQTASNGRQRPCDFEILGHEVRIEYVWSQQPIPFGLKLRLNFCSDIKGVYRPAFHDFLQFGQQCLFSRISHFDKYSMVHGREAFGLKY